MKKLILWCIILLLTIKVTEGEETKTTITGKISKVNASTVVTINEEVLSEGRFLLNTENDNLQTKLKTNVSNNRELLLKENLSKSNSLSPIKNFNIIAHYDDQLSIIQLKIFWNKSLEACSPLYYDFIVSPPQGDIYCNPHNYIEYYHENGNITNITLPNYMHRSEIEPGCTYSIEMSAYCSGAVFEEKTNFTLPECVGNKCACAKLSPEIGNFDVSQLTSEKLNISWEIRSNNQNSTNNLTRISLDYRPSRDDDLIMHDLPFGMHIVDIEKPETKSSVIISTKNFRNGQFYDIRGEFENTYSCSSDAYIKNFTIFMQAMMIEREKSSRNWLKIPIIIIFVSLVLVLIAFYVRKKVIILKKIFHNNTNFPTSSNIQRNIVPDIINPLYQQQPLIIKDTVSNKQLDPFEFPRNNLILIKFVNGGEFGEVHLGKALNIAGKPGWTYVAVKKAKDIHKKSEVNNDFLDEINILKKIPCHPHIVSLLGYCTKDYPYLIVMEFVPCGSLIEYLLELRSKWLIFRKRKATNSECTFNEGSECSYIYPENLENENVTLHSVQLHSTAETEYTNLNSEGASSASPTTTVGHFTMEYLLDHKELTNFSLQISKGMAHLEKLGITHRDLAARNILIDEFKTLKITDFGLSRYGTYVVVNKMKLPVRWMAIESIRDFVFSNKTDVWSFAVVLWEIGTLGGLPYKEVPVNLLHNHILSGHKLPRPQICTDQLYALMKRCWSDNPKDRPTFEELVEIQSKKKLEAYIDFSLLNPTYMFPPTD